MCIWSYLVLATCLTYDWNMLNTYHLPGHYHLLYDEGWGLLREQSSPSMLCGLLDHLLAPEPILTIDNGAPDFSQALFLDNPGWRIRSKSRLHRKTHRVDNTFASMHALWRLPSLGEKPNTLSFRLLCGLSTWIVNAHPFSLEDVNETRALNNLPAHLACA